MPGIASVFRLDGGLGEFDRHDNNNEQQLLQGCDDGEYSVVVPHSMASQTTVNVQLPCS
jgi:hypothetical protein